MRRFFGLLAAKVFDRWNIAIWIAASLVTAAAGPFGTFSVLFGLERTLFWLTITGVGLFLVAIAMAAEETWLTSATQRRRELARLAVMPAIVIAVIYPLSSLLIAPREMPLSPVSATVACYLLGALICAARLAVAEMAAPAVATTKHEAQSPQPRVAPLLMRRLPDDDPGPILRLSSRDHFVEVVTANGTHALRMRLSDAVQEMEGVPGLAPHRSHWVAEDAIREVRRKGQKHYVVASDATLIPVSKSNLGLLQDAPLRKRLN